MAGQYKRLLEMRKFTASEVQRLDTLWDAGGYRTLEVFIRDGEQPRSGHLWHKSLGFLRFGALGGRVHELVLEPDGPGRFALVYITGDVGVLEHSRSIRYVEQLLGGGLHRIVLDKRACGRLGIHSGS